MSWFRRCKDAVAKWGTGPAKFLLKTVLPAAIPGSGLVVDVADRVLSLVGGGAAEGDFAEVATETELNTVGKILAEFDDRLAHLAEQLLEREDDSPEKLARLVVQEIKKDKELADALRDIAGLVSRFDRIDEAQRELLRKVGYGNDLQETMLGVARRQEVLILDFVQDQQVAKGQLRELADNVAKLNLAISDLAARPADALPKLRLLEAEQPNAAAVREAVAVGAAFAFDLDLTASSLERAVQLRPDDKPLAELCRQVTIKTRGIGGDSSRKPPKPAQADAGFRPGDTIDGWKLLQLLGKGGYGQVFKAERNGVVRALKVMLRELITDPHFEANFKKEIVVLCSLGKQSHVVQFDEFGYDKATGNWYFTMEYIEGESLQTRLMRGPLPAPEAVKLFTLLAGPGGLATVHEKGIVHRDIKPANILITADGTPKLVDFGVAVTTQREEKTKSGGHTVMFASPEQLRGFLADKPSDVYSLVGCLWYALTKQEPGLYEPEGMPSDLKLLEVVFEKGLQHRLKARYPNTQFVHAQLLQYQEARDQSKAERDRLKLIPTGKRTQECTGEIRRQVEEEIRRQEQYDARMNAERLVQAERLRQAEAERLVQAERLRQAEAERLRQAEAQKARTREQSRLMEEQRRQQQLEAERLHWASIHQQVEAEIRRQEEYDARMKRSPTS